MRRARHYLGRFVSYNDASPEFFGRPKFFYIVRNHRNILEGIDSQFIAGPYDTPDEGFVSTWWISELWNSRISEIYETD